ncbi:protein TALPID3 isoform X2 [Phyllopteryx taeniolatus]|uniref:protein TALPID3 isoform X2 n=1 Tax=Phyllopteryx taeniolatus TaxID=161469 RepID=UPI002AD45F8B|nr:protein TALPID3 isoform X2 [Phyllopteryx taeniolatus]XP_061650340.1 protein TALPID3 isoform X2 [Phyllopteryx taeniolatus]
MSVLSSRLDVSRTRLSARTGPDAEPANGPLHLTIQKVSGEHRRSSRHPKPHGGAPRRTPAGSQPGHDLLTSHFEVGSRGAVLAALKQRSLSAPQRREVKVQLLEPHRSSNCSADSGHKGARALSCKLGGAFSMSNGGTAAAAIGEDRRGVRRGQQLDAIDRENWASGRGLSKMEALHNRRLELQNRPLQSAPGIVARRTPDDPARRGAQQVDVAATVINPSARTSMETDPVTTATCTDHTREERRPTVVSVATQANDSLAAPANEAATEAGPAQTESGPVPPSALEEARQLLRRLQRQKKVLDENLETVERVRTGEVLHCQLEALAANSESSERARIKRTVDAWIHLIGKDVQDRMEAEAANRRTFPTGEAAGRSSARLGRPASALKGTGSKRTPAGRGLRSQPAAPIRAAQPGPVSFDAVDDESYLTRLYGRPPHGVPTPGLKRSPPLRLSSVTAPVNRKPRPPVVDAMKGAKVKPSLPPALRPAPAQPQPPRLTSTPMAIPLARPRIGPSPRCPQTVTSCPVALPLVEHAAPDPPAADSPATHSHALDPPAPYPPSQLSPVPMEEHEELVMELGGVPDEGREVKLDSPVSQEQAEPEDAVEARPPSSITVAMVGRRSKEEQEGGSGFPGTDFLSIADVGQEFVAMEEYVVGEEAVLLDGGPSPSPVVYQGPVFPPENHIALPVPHHSSAPNLDENMLNRMVQWVEQQLMSRLISKQFPPSLPVSDQNDQSDVEERSLTSDIVEAAGGGGLQFFIDAGICVDSPLVKELVHEVLAEMMDQVLVPREAPVPGPTLGPKPGSNPESGVASFFQEKTFPVVPVVVTPLPTPLPSPVPSIRDPIPFSTPPRSEPTSLLIEDSPWPIITAPPEPISTPVGSPEADLFGEIPPAVHQALTPASSEKASLSLDEEEDHLDAHTQPLDVQDEEKPVALPPHAPSPVQADPEPPSSASEDTTSSTNSSTVTGSDTGFKLVSEGELLISFNHTDAITDEATSSSSLQDVDLDPPSEGQVKVHTIEGQEAELSMGEVTRSATPQRDGKINHSEDALFEATNESFDYDLTPVPGQTPTSDLQSEPSQVTRTHEYPQTHTHMSTRTHATTQQGNIVCECVCVF